MLLFEGDIQNWTTEFVIIGAAILVIILIAILMFKPKKKVKAVKQEEVKVKEEKAPTPVADEVQTESAVKTPVEKKQDANMTPKTEVKKETVEVKEEKPKTSTKTSEAKAPVKADEEEVDEDEDDTNPNKPKRPAKYHISQNKDTDAEHAGEWRVRKEGSTKTIKYFKTQKEAIAFAEKLAENQDSSIVIHKRDGSIRKQDYTKK